MHFTTLAVAIVGFAPADATKPMLVVTVTPKEVILCPGEKSQITVTTSLVFQDPVTMKTRVIPYPNARLNVNRAQFGPGSESATYSKGENLWKTDANGKATVQISGMRPQPGQVPKFKERWCFWVDGKDKNYIASGNVKIITRYCRKHRRLPQDQTPKPGDVKLDDLMRDIAEKIRDALGGKTDDSIRKPLGEIRDLIRELPTGKHLKPFSLLMAKKEVTSLLARRRLKPLHSNELAAVVAIYQSVVYEWLQADKELDDHVDPTRRWMSGLGRLTKSELKQLLTRIHLVCFEIRRQLRQSLGQPANYKNLIFIEPVLLIEGTNALRATNLRSIRKERTPKILEMVDCSGGLRQWGSLAMYQVPNAVYKELGRRLVAAKEKSERESLLSLRQDAHELFAATRALGSLLSWLHHYQSNVRQGRTERVKNVPKTYLDRFLEQSRKLNREAKFSR